MLPVWVDFSFLGPLTQKLGETTAVMFAPVTLIKFLKTMKTNY